MSPMSKHMREANTKIKAKVLGECQPDTVPVPQGLARSDAEFWLRNRTAILQAIADQGFTLVSTAHGFRLMKFGKVEAQGKEASNG